MAKQVVKSSLWRRLESSARTIQEAFGREALPDTLVVLGSGFKGFECHLKDARQVELADIPHFPVPNIAGHGASLVIGETPSGQDICVLTGRVHLYESYRVDEVVYAIRVMSTLGVQKVLLTNAAGSVDLSIKPGSLVLASDQINLTGQNCLCGPEAQDLGPIFVDMGQAFDPQWRLAIKDLPQAKHLREGVYAGVLGPAYETPAEAKMLSLLGVNVVGMSTVQEVLAARQLQMRTVVLSFVTNMAGGLGGGLTHEDVIDLVAKHQDELHQILLAAASLQV